MQVTAEGGPIPYSGLPTAATAGAGTDVGQKGGGNKHAALVAALVVKLLRLVACVVATAGGLAAAAAMAVRVLQ